jgi:hypothetical protein
MGRAKEKEQKGDDMKKLLTLAITILLIAQMIVPVLAADLVQTEVVASTPNAIIEVEQGQTVNFIIQLTATGAISGGITSGNPSTAAVHTAYSVVGGTPSSSTPSDYYNFYASGTPSGGSGNCVVTWDDAPAPYEVSATAYASPDATPGDYVIRIAATFSNPDGPGAKLGDGEANSLIVRVIAAASGDTTPPEITAPEDVEIEGNTVGGANVVASDLGTATATDDVDPDPTITNDFVPGFYALGTTTTVTWTATDASGNSASATQTFTIVDTTPPVIDVPATFSVLVNAPESVLTGSASDIVDANPTLTNNAPDFFPPGTTIVTWTATDASGNSATATTTVTATYNVIGGGFLRPIDMDGTSVFKLGSTVPTKFQLTDYYGNYVSTAIANLKTAQITDNTVGDDVEAISTAAATTGSLFRYDTTSDQYIFNLGTKTLARGSYKITAVLDSGQTIQVVIGLK